MSRRKNPRIQAAVKAVLSPYYAWLAMPVGGYRRVSAAGVSAREQRL